MSKQNPHEKRNVPGCLACSDPAQLPGWLASERARADVLAAQATQARAAGREAGERALAAVIAHEYWKTIRDLQREEVRLCGEANGIAQHVLMIRAHADRVEAAHPDADQQGSLFNQQEAI